MSKAAPNRRPRKQKKPHKQKSASSAGQQSRKKFAVFALIAVLAAIPFGLGKYFEFNSPGAFDSGAYVYSAKRIVDGAKIGADEKPSAQPGTLLVNMLGVWMFGFNETGPQLLQGVFQAAALVLMFIAMRKLFGTVAGAVGVIMASVYLSAPLIAKFGNVKEQYMTAFMVIGMSSFVLGQIGGKWWWTVLAGAFLAWAPLFKQTGTSVVGAVGLFVLVQPLLKHRSWKQTGKDILLLLTGGAVSVGPVYLWLAAVQTQAPITYWPYMTLVRLFLPIEGVRVSTYVSKARQLHGFSTQWPRVIRYYGLLILPISLATASIVAGLIRLVLSGLARLKKEQKKGYERFVLLFAVWWLIDMGYVWISPRSYEQYYLPLNASAAMLGGYVIALYWDKVSSVVYKNRWGVIGVVGFVCMLIMSWHIFFGIEKSPHSGGNYGEKRRGYAQKLADVSARRRNNLKGAWEIVSEYIRLHSEPADRIYVWGWYPGIYVKSQRLSSTPKACEGAIHTMTPEAFLEKVDEILSAFRKHPPKFIVDTHKSHFPWDRPPLELWPRTRKGFLPADKQIINEYDAAYSTMLREKIEPEEALRYEAMKPLREFVMENYKIVPIKFGQHVLFEHK